LEHTSSVVLAQKLFSYRPPYRGVRKKVSTRVWIYQYTFQEARNGSGYCEMSFLGALSLGNFRVLAA